MIDRDELRVLWAERTDLSLRQIADHFHVTPSTLAGMIRRAQQKEGTKRWPKRASVIPEKPKPKPPPRAGATTLPPLGSLDGSPD